MKESDVILLCPICGCNDIPTLANGNISCSRCGNSNYQPLSHYTLCPLCFQPLIYTNYGFYVCSNSVCHGYYLDSISPFNDNIFFKVCHTHLNYNHSIVNKPIILLKKNIVTGKISLPDFDDGQPYVDNILQNDTLQDYSESCFISQFLIKVASRLL